MISRKFLTVIVLLVTTTVSADESSTEDWYTTDIPITCGGNITDFAGSFSSPDFPSSYPNNADCIWLITVPGWDSGIEMWFEGIFATETNYDFLEIRDGPDQNSPLIRRMTGTVTSPLDIHSNSRYIWAWFHSDGSGVARGFRAFFSENVGTGSTEVATTATDPQTIPSSPEPSTIEPSTPEPSTPEPSTPEPSTFDPSTLEPSTPPGNGCDQTFNGVWGTFNSPEFPFYYPFNSDCEYRFFAPQGFRVHITLGQQLSLEHDRECAYDHLEFRDGPNPDSQLITRICGYHEVPLAITSTSNSLYARFHSDDQFNAQGFVGIYQTRQAQILELEERRE